MWDGPNGLCDSKCEDWELLLLVFYPNCKAVVRIILILSDV